MGTRPAGSRTTEPLPAFSSVAPDSTDPSGEAVSDVSGAVVDSSGGVVDSPGVVGSDESAGVDSGGVCSDGGVWSVVGALVVVAAGCAGVDASSATADGTARPAETASVAANVSARRIGVREPREVARAWRRSW
ncbi:hypothetical protein [Gordonia jinhuaensis]|uniref:hypothetical protein n=1 Tax=Gordonia jinhuaensis TaxID=1517702 RepID=UPI0016694F2A|nr:hypothetical protein [Gordonia jinhuaensis]